MSEGQKYRKAKGVFEPILGKTRAFLAACLDAAERVLDQPEFNRWPSVPVLRYGENVLSDGPVVSCCRKRRMMT